MASLFSFEASASRHASHRSWLYNWKPLLVTRGQRRAHVNAFQQICSGIFEALQHLHSFYVPGCGEAVMGRRKKPMGGQTCQSKAHAAHNASKGGNAHNQWDRGWKSTHCRVSVALHTLQQPAGASRSLPTHSMQ
eukprot:1149604-Pelagomonas_calceolata.AAC.7